MKTKLFITTAICTWLALGVQAQQTTTRENVKLTLITEKDGKKEVIEKVFSSEKELEEYMKSRGAELPGLPIPPDKPLPPALPALPDVEGKQGLSCKKVIVINKEAVGNEGDDVTVDFTGEYDLPAGEKADKYTEERIVIVRKEKPAVNEAKVEEPKQVWVQKEEKPAVISELSFFPNPSYGTFNVQFNVSEPSDVQLRIFDLDGKEIYTDSVKNFSGLYQKKVYRGELAPGTYLMEVSTGREKQTLKISIQK